MWVEGNNAEDYLCSLSSLTVTLVVGDCFGFSWAGCSSLGSDDAKLRDNCICRVCSHAEHTASSTPWACRNMRSKHYKLQFRLRCLYKLLYGVQYARVFQAPVGV